MTSHLETLRRWRHRAAPKRSDIIRAMLVGACANVAGAGLFVGAITLLAFSAGHPSWRSIAIALIIIETIAFLRSPLRFAERMTSHHLGYAAVTTWRRWLVETVGLWPRSTWRAIAQGDVLERSLHDTDELQSLWVRGILPLMATATTMLAGDVVLFIVTKENVSPLVAVLLLQALVFAICAALFPRLAAADAHMRDARGTLVATLVSISSTAREVRLLGAERVVRERITRAQHPLAAAEARFNRLRSRCAATIIAGTLLTLGVLWWTLPPLSATGLVAAAWIALATIEQADAVPAALDSLVAVIGAGERLDALDIEQAPRTTRATTGLVSIAWSPAHTHTPVELGRRVAVIGPSGSGKTRLLERLAGLDDGPTGLFLDGHDSAGLEEQSLRRVVRYVPADPGLVRGLVRDTLGLGAPVTPELLAMARQLGLNFELDDRIEDLSRGERQRFAVVRALATSPRVLLLDEPTSGLGREDTRKVLELLAQQPVVTVIASHDHDVVAWCHDVVDVTELAV